MSSAIAGRQYRVPCPACGTATPVEEGGPDADRRTCAGCGSRLVILRTDTMFMAAIPAPPRPAPAGGRADADDIVALWTALASW